MRNIKIILEYDGTDFCGWQLQPKERTVQGVLESSLKQLLQELPVIHASGRTDAGVHALAQVANFKTESELTVVSIQNGVNSYLPADVRVLCVEEADEAFHSRYDAVKRTYRYIVGKKAKAVGRHYSWFCNYKLDIRKLRQASECLIGEHSFEAFAKLNQKEKHYLCNVESVRWEESEENLSFIISANRYLHHMVRILLGTMIDVGRGKLLPGDVQDILASMDRRRAGSAAPAHGLFLVRVDY
ncbi:MAG: tRNA pseudouridine(38-40) synthase TruA [Caldithrix sp.]|nr:MAG: tRNA pseudouridine(38-40) synthase TruA [Caldithrix sp.]TDJ03425.1 MAG: tRNA pseudouridine(38-40) synthase TruA [Caldithrix sp.]